MIKRTIHILLILLLITSCAQESVLFETRYKPNKKYTKEVKTSFRSVVDFIADEKSIEEIKTYRNSELPLISETEFSYSTILHTQDTQIDGCFLANFRYGKASSTITENNKVKPTDQIPYDDIEIKGKFDTNNHFITDTIVGKELSENFRNSLSKTIETSQETINFPNKPLKLGDSFEIKSQILTDDKTIGAVFNISTKFILKELNKNVAVFDLETSIIDCEQKSISIYSGKGVGTVEFSISENQVTKYSFEFPINYSFKNNGKDRVNYTANIKTTTKSEQILKIE